MDLFNLPFFRSYEAQLGWLISRVKNVETSEANAKASEEAAAESAGEAAGSAQAAAVQAAHAETSANNAANSAAGIANIVTTVNADHARLDELIASGETTVDNSEVIDIRAGAVTTFGLAGNETRYIGLLSEKLQENYKAIKPAPAVIHPYSVLNPNGTIAALEQTTTNAKFRVLEYNVTAGEMYSAWTYSQWGNALGSFLDSDDNVFGRINGRGGSDSFAYVERFVIPQGCVKFYLAEYLLTGDTYAHRCLLIKHEKSDDYTIPEGIINTLSPASEEPITPDYSGGLNHAFNYANGYEQSLSGYQWAMVPVTPNAQYRITGWTYYDYHLYGLVKTDGSVVWNSEYGDRQLDKYVYIPADCFAVVLQGKITTPSTISIVTGWTYESSGYWHGKKWTAFGDSLTENNATADNKYHSIISALTGITVVNMGLSGSGYARPSSSSFYERAANIPSDTDVVTIFGSFNDSAATGVSIGTPSDTGTNTICGCINRTLETIYSIKPDMVVGLITPTPWSQFNPYDGGSRKGVSADGRYHAVS